MSYLYRRNLDARSKPSIRRQMGVHREIAKASMPIAVARAALNDLRRSTDDRLSVRAAGTDAAAARGLMVIRHRACRFPTSSATITLVAARVCRD